MNAANSGPAVPFPGLRVGNTYPRPSRSAASGPIPGLARSTHPLRRLRKGSQDVTRHTAPFSANPLATRQFWVSARYLTVESSGMPSRADPAARSPPAQIRSQEGAVSNGRATSIEDSSAREGHMKQGIHKNEIRMLVGAALFFSSTAWAGWPGDPAKCKPDAVKAGSVCIDKYEASVWQVPATNPNGKSNAGLIKKIQNGTVKLADLTAGGATQVSPAAGCIPANFPTTFPANGQWTAPLYAASIPGVQPTGCISWFQAQQACGNARKRLPTNAEWQLAAAGTPDPGSDNGITDCNSAAFTPVNTGSRSNCVSNWGAFDMVGNMWEWVADWVPRSTACGSWGASTDTQCLAGAATTGEPAAFVRGGSFVDGTDAGPLAVQAGFNLFFQTSSFGFRCAR